MDIYLLNQIFTQEYLAITKVLKSNPTALKSFYTSKKGVAFWKRASLASYLANSLKQNIGDAALLERLLKAHKAAIEINDKLAFERMVGFGLFKGGVSSILYNIEKDSDLSDIDSYVAAFKSINNVKNIEPLQVKDEEAILADLSERINLKSDDINDELLANYLSKKYGNRLREVVALLMSRSLGNQEMEKLAFNLSVALHYLNENDRLVATLLVIQLIKIRNYPEALRHLFTLQKLDQAYRIPYNLVQRVFNYGQRGAGSVALKGL